MMILWRVNSERVHDGNNIYLFFLISNQYLTLFYVLVFDVIFMACDGGIMG